MNDHIIGYLISQGVLGIAVVVLGLALLTLWKENQRLHSSRIDDAEKHKNDYVDILNKDIEKDAKLTESNLQIAHSLNLLTEKINKGAK